MVYRTATGVPSGNFTARVERTETRSVSVSWTTPSSPNGIIQRYLLRSVEQLSNTTLTQYDGLALGTQVSALTPYSRYVLTVSACTSVGCLNTSVTTITLPAPPGGQELPTITTDGPTTLNVSWCTSVGCLDTSVTAITLPAPPSGQALPAITTDGPTTLNVSWQPPTQPNGTPTLSLSLYWLNICTARPCSNTRHNASCQCNIVTVEQVHAGCVSQHGRRS